MSGSTSVLTELSIKDRYSIIALSEYAGWNQNRIANTINTTQGTVSNTLKRWRDHNTVEDLPGRGPKPLIDITNINNNSIVNIQRDNRRANAKYIQYQLANQHRITISTCTIQRYRRELGFRPVHYRRRPVLTQENRRKRLNYCLDNMDQNWQEIIFTDESYFVLTDENTVIWKRPGSPTITTGATQHPFQVMVWGGIWYSGKTKLAILTGTMNADKYQSVIYEYLIKDHITDDLELLQDGAKPHTAHSTLDYFEENGVNIRQNPPSSPELNPIEKVWGWMKNEINKQNPQSPTELQQLLQSVWDTIPQTVIQQYISHNKSVVCDIIQSEGGSITEPNRHHKRATV